MTFWNRVEALTLLHLYVIDLLTLMIVQVPATASLISRNVNLASGPLQAECRAIRDDLPKASRLKLHDIIVNSDSPKAILICNRIRFISWHL